MRAPRCREHAASCVTRAQQPYLEGSAGTLGRPCGASQGYGKSRGTPDLVARGRSTSGWPTRAEQRSVAGGLAKGPGGRGGEGGGELAGQGCRKGAAGGTQRPGRHSPRICGSQSTAAPERSGRLRHQRLPRVPGRGGPCRADPAALQLPCSLLTEPGRRHRCPCAEAGSCGQRG